MGGVIRCNYEWLWVEWGGFLVVLGDFGRFWWLRVVMGSYGVDTGGFGWLLVVMVGNGVVPDGYRWLPLVMNGFDLLGLLRDGCKKSKWKFKMDFSMKGGGVSSSTYT